MEFSISCLKNKQSAERTFLKELNVSKYYKLLVKTILAGQIVETV